MRKRPHEKHFFLNDTELAQLAAKAKKAGLSEAALIRLLLCGYAPKEKPDKTSVDATIEYAMSDDRAKGLGYVIDYATNGAKTEQQYYVSALNCTVETAREEMTLTKRHGVKWVASRRFMGIRRSNPVRLRPAQHMK